MASGLARMVETLPRIFLPHEPRGGFVSESYLRNPGLKTQKPNREMVLASRVKPDSQWILPRAGGKDSIVFVSRKWKLRGP